MLDRLQRLRLVVLESPYDTWKNPLTPPLFMNIMNLKFGGYSRVYPYGVLAVDTTDLISDHLLLCEETENGLVPLFGNKSVPLNKCEKHYQHFPGLSVLEESGASTHASVIREVIKEAKLKHFDLRYAGSMTIDPKESGNKEWSKIIRELFTTIYVNYYQSIPQFEIITGATLRFKVEAYTDWLGAERLQLEGQTLGPVYVSHLANEPVVWTLQKKFSAEAQEQAKKWEHMWLNRIHIAVDTTNKENISKAA